MPNLYPKIIKIIQRRVDSYMMDKIEIGAQVQLAQFEHCIFKVTEVHADGSYSVETALDGVHVLSYQNVAREMLKIGTV